jgi:hypothetical protein
VRGARADAQFIEFGGGDEDARMNACEFGLERGGMFGFDGEKRRWRGNSGALVRAERFAGVLRASGARGGPRCENQQQDGGAR